MTHHDPATCLVLVAQVLTTHGEPAAALIRFLRHELADRLTPREQDLVTTLDERITHMLALQSLVAPWSTAPPPLTE